MKNKKIIMYFHCAGVVTKEKFDVVRETKGTITLGTDEDIKKCFQFKKSTGECINDNTIFDCKRTIKPMKIE